MDDASATVEGRNERERWLAFVQSLDPSIDPRAVRLMDELRAVARMIHRAGEVGITAAGLSMAQYRILLHLYHAESMGGRGELSPSEISARQRVSRNTVSGLIRSLEADALIARSIDPDDRRRFNIALTATGRSLVRRKAGQHLHGINDCFSVLSPDEQDQLTDLLTRITDQADPTGD